MQKTMVAIIILTGLSSPAMAIRQPVSVEASTPGVADSTDYVVTQSTGLLVFAEAPVSRFELAYKESNKSYMFSSRNAADDGFDEMFRVDEDGDMFLHGKWVGKDRKMYDLLRAMNH